MYLYRPWRLKAVNSTKLHIKTDKGCHSHQLLLCEKCFHNSGSVTCRYPSVSHCSAGLKSNVQDETYRLRGISTVTLQLAAISLFWKMESSHILYIHVTFLSSMCQEKYIYLKFGSDQFRQIVWLRLLGFSYIMRWNCSTLQFPPPK
jgi:hypothetical protein